MSNLNETEFKKLLSGNDFSGIYMIYGEEKMLVSLYTDKLVEKIAGKKPIEFNFHTFTSFKNIDEIISCADILPFAADYNCILISDADTEELFKGLSLEGNTAKDLEEKIMLLFEKAVDQTIIIISQPTITPKYSGMQKKIAEYCKKNGTALNLQKMSTNDLCKQLIKLASKRDCTLSVSNAKIIIARQGDDLHTLINELEKLCAYAQGREITSEDILKLVPESLEYSIFKLSDYTVSADVDNAINVLDNLFFRKEPPEKILGTLINTFTDMYKVRIALENNYQAFEVADVFEEFKGKDFRIRNAQRNSSKISTTLLREMLDLIFEADRKIKSTNSDNRTVLEVLVTQLAMAKNSYK